MTNIHTTLDRIAATVASATGKGHGTATPADVQNVRDHVKGLEVDADDDSVLHGAEYRASAAVAERDRLRAQVAALVELAESVRFGGHSHWDPTQRRGAGCPVCELQRNERARIEAAIGDLDATARAYTERVRAEERERVALTIERAAEQRSLLGLGGGRTLREAGLHVRALGPNTQADEPGGGS